MKKKILMIFTLVAFTLTALVPSSVLANASDQWKKAGINPDSNINTSGVFNDLNTLVGIVIAFGGFWIILCLIFAGIKLASAQGGNPQARTAGFIGIGMAFVGGWVIMKAYDIAGFIAGFGG